MPHSAPTVGRVLLIACCLALTLAACGRRGRLEAPDAAPAAVIAPPSSPRMSRADARPRPPVNPNAPLVDADDDEEDEDDQAQRIAPTPSPVPTAQRKSRNYTIPKEPFFLDPLL